MDGKRPDQHNIDSGEAGSSDHKEQVNPAQRELRDRKAARNDQGGMSDDERVDEASKESFPASDPPAQP